MHWIVANHKREHTGSVLVAGNTCRPTDTTTNELTDPLIYAIDAELDRDDSSSEDALFDEIGFVSSNCVGQTSRDRARPWRLAPVRVNALYCVRGHLLS